MSVKIAIISFSSYRTIFLKFLKLKNKNELGSKEVKI